MAGWTRGGNWWRDEWTTRVGIGCCLVLIIGLGGCASTPEDPTPLALSGPVSSGTSRSNEEGRRAYLKGDYQRAKESFGQVVAAAPDSGEAHYNLGLAMHALGEKQEARQHFIKAANLAPGNKIIWDSPALRPYGTLDTSEDSQPAPSVPGSSPGLGGMGSGAY